MIVLRTFFFLRDYIIQFAIALLLTTSFPTLSILAFSHPVSVNQLPSRSGDLYEFGPSLDIFRWCNDMSENKYTTNDTLKFFFINLYFA